MVAYQEHLRTKDIKMQRIITIDGPSGSGKSSVAEKVAQRLVFQHYNTGNIYRSLACAANYHGLQDNPEELVELINLIDRITWSPVKVTIHFGGSKVQEFQLAELRSESTTDLIAKLASNTIVGPHIVRIVQNSQPKSNFLADGRNTGSALFPSEDVKIYLEAESIIRFDRVASAHGEEVARLNFERDERDKNREFAPLCVPEGAHLVDSSRASIEDVVENICSEFYKIAS